MLKKLSIVFLLCLFASVAGFAEETVNDVAQAECGQPSELFAEFELFYAEPGYANAGKGNGKGGSGGGTEATCTANCGITTISCTGSSCRAADRNCPLTQGFVRCDGVSTFCPNSCPVSNCPTRPGCSYIYIIADGCCVDTLNQPGYYCPDICE